MRNIDGVADKLLPFRGFSIKIEIKLKNKLHMYKNTKKMVIVLINKTLSGKLVTCSNFTGKIDNIANFGISRSFIKILNLLILECIERSKACEIHYSMCCCENTKSQLAWFLAY